MPAHKRVIDEDEVIKYALAGCYDKTIARLTGIPETTLKRRCGVLISKKRAERKYNIREAQDKAVKAGVPAVLIFLGKNELGQTDRQDLRVKDVSVPQLGEAEQQAITDLARSYKVKLAKGLETKEAE